MRRVLHRFGVVAVMLAVSCTGGRGAIPAGGVPSVTVQPGSDSGQPASVLTADPSEALLFVAGCLRDAGFSVTVDVGAGSWEAHVPPEQQDKLTEVVISCSQAATEQGLIPSSLPSRDELETMYAINELISACLADHDYPTVDAPSLEQFLDSGGLTWDPFLAALEGIWATPDPDHAGYDTAEAQLYRSCPQAYSAWLPLLTDR